MPPTLTPFDLSDEPAIRGLVEHPSLAREFDHFLGLDAVARAVSQLSPEADPADVGAYTIDPAVCVSNPRLEMVSPALAEALAAAIRESTTPNPVDRDAAMALVERIGSDACAGAYARMVAAGVRDQDRGKLLGDAEQDAERCNDDRVRAETAIRAAAFAAGRSVFGIPSTTIARLSPTSRRSTPAASASLAVGAS